MRLDINLASHPYQDLRSFWMRWGTSLAGAVLLTLILLGVTIEAWFRAHRDWQAIGQMQSQVTELDQEAVQAKAYLDRPENRTTRDRSEFLNDLFRRKAFSWTKVFEELERIMPGRLRVVSIHPELGSDNQLRIRLLVAGDSRDRALELVRKMEESQHFRKTQIQQETAELGDPSGATVQFDISALYVPDIAQSLRAGGSQ